MIDSHCHLDFFSNITNVYEKAVSKGVTALINPSVGHDNWEKVYQLGLEMNVYPALGIHPLFVHQHQAKHLRDLENFIDNYDCVAIGECGLDKQAKANADDQLFYFKAQIEISLTFNKPLIIHSRGTLEEIIHRLKKYQGVKFVIHSFSGSDQQLSQIKDLGGLIGVGGTVTYPRAQRLRKQIASIDQTSFILETDAPDAPIFGEQGKQNTPDKILEIAKIVAELREEEALQVIHHSDLNCKKLFNL